MEPKKNINEGNIDAKGNVHIGDIIININNYNDYSTRVERIKELEELLMLQTDELKRLETSEKINRLKIEGRRFEKYVYIGNSLEVLYCIPYSKDCD